MIRDRACRITDTPSHFKNGKHGKAKVAGSAQDIFDASKVFPPHIFLQFSHASCSLLLQDNRP